MSCLPPTGFSIIKTVRPEGRVSLISGRKASQPATAAIQLLNSVLKDKGYVALEQGKILKIDTVDHARHANISPFAPAMILIRSIPPMS